MNKILFIRLSLGAAALAVGAGGLYACSDDTNTVVESCDASVTPGDGGGPGDSGPPDTGTPDTGTDTGVPDSGPKPVSCDPYGRCDGTVVSSTCPIIGPNDVTSGGWQTNFGSKECNDCIRSKCCAPFTLCYTGGADAGSSLLPDGGYGSACANMSDCYLNNCSGVADAGGCHDDCQAATGADNTTRNLVDNWLVPCMDITCGNGAAPDGGVACAPY